MTDIVARAMANVPTTPLKNISNTDYSNITQGGTVSFKLKPNIVYDFGEIESLNIDLEISQNTRVCTYSFFFTSGENATVLTLPANIKWGNGFEPEIKVNSTYQFSICNEVALWCTDNSNGVGSGKDATINGVNTLTIESANGVNLTQDGDVLTISAHEHDNKAILDEFSTMAIDSVDILKCGDKKVGGTGKVIIDSNSYSNVIYSGVSYIFTSEALTEISITSLIDSFSDEVNEFSFTFISSAIPATLSLPASVKWANELTVGGNKKYQISIVDNIALWAAVDWVV